jgi:hypothetical protein
METEWKRIGPQDVKEKRDSPPRESLQEILQQGAGSSGAPLMGPAATSEPSVEISVEGRDEPVVRNLPDVKPRTPILGVSSTDTPLQGASSSSIPTEGEGLDNLAYGVSGFRPAKKTLSGSARRKLKKARGRVREAGTGGIQQPGNAGAPKQGGTSTETLKRPRSEGSNPTAETVSSPKMPRDSSGPGTYMEELTNIKIAIFRETYPEDKITEDDQNCILEELGRVFRATPVGELPLLKSHRLEGGALIYMCANQQSGQWLIRAIGNHRLESGARLKATDARNLPKPIKVALRIGDKVAQSQDELLKWIKNLNPGLHTEHWRILHKQPELKGQRLIMLIDQDSLSAIKMTGYKIFTGLSQGVVKVMEDPNCMQLRHAQLRM